MSVLQYVVMQVFLVVMLALPVKILARLMFRIKYIWVTPWLHMSDQEKDPVVHSSLSKALVIWSALLAVSMIWGLYDEMYGIRPWKGSQAKFKKLYRHSLATARLSEADREKQIRSQPESKLLDRDTRAAEKAATPEASA